MLVVAVSASVTVRSISLSERFIRQFPATATACVNARVNAVHVASFLAEITGLCVGDVAVCWMAIAQPRVPRAGLARLKVHLEI